jgi:hypothetical protein
MTGSEQYALRMKHGRRAAAIGAAAAVAMLASASSAFAAPRATPAASSAAAVTRTRQAAGWAPVPYRSAQLSVPGSWLVESPQQLTCAFSPTGMIFAGIRPHFPKSIGCGLTASLAWIVPAGNFRRGIGHRKPTAVINGIPVYRLRSAKGTVLYLVPDLGVRVGASGPSARRVLATLTRSPLSVVLRTGPAAPVPADWGWRRFGGVRFATPRSWSLQREDQWATCGTGLWPRTLLLLDATKPPAPLPCPYPDPTASNDQAYAGLTVVTGKYAAESVGESYPRCRVRDGARICLSSVTGQGGLLGAVLIFSASRPHRHAATFLLLGLSGSGAVARAVLGSITVAAR